MNFSIKLNFTKQLNFTLFFSLSVVEVFHTRITGEVCMLAQESAL